MRKPLTPGLHLDGNVIIAFEDTLDGLEPFVAPARHLLWADQSRSETY